MHTVNKQGANKAYDAHDPDWSAYMRFALPEAAWVPIPDLGEATLNFAARWGLDGLIIRGDDSGENPERDATDTGLLNHFIENGLPVFGVGRGLQLIQVALGGTLTRYDCDAHAAKPHPVRTQNDPADLGWYGIRAVNSFHRYGIALSDLHASLYSIASTSDNQVEAAVVGDGRIAGLMWHPERESEYNLRDKSLMRWLFGYEVK